MSDKYFEEKKLNTELKHKILKMILTKSISIASVSRLRKQKDAYAFADFYAGEGIHDDGNLGSPLIALETIDSINLQNDFEKYNCIFTEIDNNRCDILKTNVTEYLNKMKKKEIIDVFCNHGDWCNYAQKIIEILTNSKWGFLFVDPFANQINMDLFLEILNTEYIYSLKDIMIFINYNAFKRLIGTKNDNLLSQVANFFGIPLDKLKEQIDDVPSGNINFTLFNELLINRLKSTNKEFICGTSIPNTKKGKLTNSDYFFLIFCTTDINMVDEFYKKYQLLLNEYKFEIKFINELHLKIDEVLSNQWISLLDLYKIITSSFISWKSNLPVEIPTKNQIIDYLNECRKKDTIEYEVENNNVLFKKSDFQKLKKSLTKRDMEGIKIIDKTE